MANYDSNYAIAQEISARIGTAPVPFDSVYSICLAIYQELGGTESTFDSVYSILLEILPLAVSGKDAIVDVDVLPDAEANKNKLVRYEGNLYYVKPSEIKAVKFTALEDGSSVGLARICSVHVLESSLDGETWTSFDTTTSISLNSGESIFIRGNYTSAPVIDDYTQFAISGKVKVAGNINYMWGGNDTLYDYCAYLMFSECSGLVDAEELYLPSTDLSLECYNGLFSGCINLTKTPKQLPATVAAQSCYSYMFENTPITTAPEIFLTTLAKTTFYATFQGCTNLTTAPAIISTDNSPLGCFIMMFNGCTSLQYIKNLSIPIAAGYSKFTQNVAGTGTFVKATNTTWVSGIKGIPEGWEIVNDDTVPEYHYEWHGIYVYDWVEIPIIDDNSIALDKTWSSNKINSDLTEFNEKINNVKPIEEVSELPEASENKDKLFRLDNGEKDVYAAKLLSSETITTNKLPDEQQINKACLYETIDDIYYYKGAFKLICTDGEINGYGWQSSDEFVIFTLDNAVSATLESHQYLADEADGWILDGNTATTTNFSVSDIESAIEEGDTLSEYGISGVIPAIYNAPESAQIGNANVDDTFSFNNWFYVGDEEIIEVDGTSLTCYTWHTEGTSELLFSTKPASEIYYVTQPSTGFDIYNSKFYLNTGDGLELIRMEGFFIPQLNAPDSEQVGNAYIGTNGEVTNLYYYKGECTLIDTEVQETYTAYRWDYDGDNVFTVKDANQTVPPYESVLIYTGDDDFIDAGNNTYSNTNIYNDGVLSDLGLESNVYIVKYQRTETIEEWGWEKIATEQYVDDAIASVDVKPITNVSALPDAEANKDSVLRLEGDKKIYLSKYNLNNAPDAQQVGIAYVSDDEGNKVYYTGTEVTIIAQNGTFTGYVWLYEGETISDVDLAYKISTIKAEEITNDTALFYNGRIHYVSGTTFESNENLTTVTMHEAWDLADGYYIKPVGYEWKRVVTEDELASLEARIAALEHPNS